MFGMGDKKKKADSWTFDLEEELKDVKNLRQWQEKTDGRIQQLKSMLRQGENKKTFDDAQTLLHGYLAGQKVVQRIGR